MDRAVLRRFPARLLLAPPGHRLAGAVVPPPGSRIVAGALAVDVDAVDPVARRPGGAGPPARRARRDRFAAMRLTLGARTYDVATRALVMGILNRTPDSFFDKGATGTSTPSSAGPSNWSPKGPTSSTSAGSRPAPVPT